jgi:hypothetical protein
LAEQLFEFGNASLVVVAAGVISFEERVQVFDGVGFPVGEELRRERMLAAKLGLAVLAAEELKDNLGLELGRERAS